MLRFYWKKNAVGVARSPAAMLILVLAVLAITSIAGTAAGQESVAEIQENLNLIWIIAAATMVFFMQIGFTAFEAGSVQAKNAISVSLKNITICMLCAVFYFLVGFALMFGKTKLGLIGTNNFLFFGVGEMPLGYAFAFFQVVFASTAATIITGAMAERTRLVTHIWSTILMVCVVYPIYGHWAWGGSFHYGQSGWLARIGFIDFAGSTVVHSVGAWFGLAGALLAGPRIGKYNKDGTVNKMGGHNIPLATIGTLFLWFGWFGFNGGSTLRADASVGAAIINTNIAAGAGGTVCLLFGWLRARRFDAEAILLGILGALVAITAGSDRVEPWGALLIGAVAGALVLLGYDLLDKIFKVDDPVGAITVHGFGGVVGTIAVALLAPVDTLMVPNHSRLLQVGVQFLGIVIAFAWAFGLGFLFFWAVNKIVRIRSKPEEEVRGLNLAEYEDVSAWLNLSQIHRLQDLNVLLERRIEDRTQQLSEAKKYTDSIIQSMREMMVVTDTDWSIRDVNPTVEALLGYRREELIGRPVNILTSRDEQLFQVHTLRKLLEEEGVIHDYRVDFRTKHNEEVPVVFTGSIMRDDAGRPVGMVGIARDMSETIGLIKELQKINEELGISNEKFQTTMRSVRVPIATLDVGRRILSVNPAFEGLTGWGVKDVSGRQYDVLLSLAVGTKGFLTEEPETWLGKAIIKNKGGRTVDVSYTEAPLKDPQGGIIGMVCTLEDISREAEIDRMKTEFISTVSHELRTPLTAIKGYVDLILEGDTGEINETQRDFLQLVAHSSDRLTALINDLLDVERIESGRAVMRRELVDINLIIRDVTQTFDKEIAKRGLTLQTNIPVQVPEVVGDRERIEQVLANLVSNAIKYNRPSGYIRVLAGLEGTFVRIDVIDSGIGISKKNLGRLFERFFRVDISTAGAGLGLAIVKSIIEKMGGKIRVESRLGEGSTFTVLLPTEKSGIEFHPETVVFE